MPREPRQPRQPRERIATMKEAARAQEGPVFRSLRKKPKTIKTEPVVVKHRLTSPETAQQQAPTPPQGTENEEPSR